MMMGHRTKKLTSGRIELHNVWILPVNSLVYKCDNHYWAVIGKNNFWQK